MVKSLEHSEQKRNRGNRTHGAEVQKGGIDCLLGWLNEIKRASTRLKFKGELDPTMG
jgi:hypothetical protein